MKLSKRIKITKNTVEAFAECSCSCKCNIMYSSRNITHWDLKTIQINNA